MSDEQAVSQPQQLAGKLDHWFELFDEKFALDDMPLSKRPAEAVFELMRNEAIAMRFGDEPPIDLSNPWEHVTTIWFRVLYMAAEYWYAQHYGKKAMASQGNPPLLGVTLIRRAPFLVKVPMHRSVIVEVGRKAWMYFEDKVVEDEDPIKWIVDPPNLQLMPATEREADVNRLKDVCGKLRRYNFQLLGAPHDGASAGFIQAIRTYLESGARRIHSGAVTDLGPAWFDLQMAMESALKLAQHAGTKRYSHIHDLKQLLRETEPLGVSFYVSRLGDWPEFPEMSNLRYAQAPAGGTAVVFEGYLLALDVVVAALSVLKPALGPGFGLLLQPWPWLLDPLSPREGAE